MSIWHSKYVLRITNVSYFNMPRPQVEMSTDETVVPGTSQDSEPQRQSPYTITEEILQKRLKSENRGRYITQLCAALAASLATFSFGTILGWSSPSSTSTSTLKGSMSTYNFTKEEIEDYAWISSLMPLGCSVGILPWSYTVNKIGPKHTLMIQTPLYILTIVVIITVRKFYIYLAGRFFSGFLSIANIIGGECLLMDTVHRGNLPHMIVFFRSSIWLGVLSSYVIGYLWSKYILTIVCACIPTLNTMLLIFLPESPVFLYDQSELKAEQALSWYRGNANTSTEMRSIRKDAEIRKIGPETYRYMFFSEVVMKGLLIVLGLTFFQISSGYYAFVFYTLFLWDDVHHLLNPLAYAIIFGLSLYVSNFVATMVHYRMPFGVRKPLLLSTSLVAIILTLLSIYLFLNEKRMLQYEELHWIPIVLVNGLVISYEIGLSTYADILLFEYLPYQVHVRAKIILRICFWIQVFLFTKYFITLTNVTNNYVPFAILAAITFVGIIYCYLFVIETKEKNLLQIQIEIGGNPIGNRGAYRNRIGSTTTPLVPIH